MAADSDGPLLICYDGSESAKHAIKSAAGLFGGRRALILTVWQPTAGVGGFAWSGAMAPMVDFVELDRAAAKDARRIATGGVRIAKRAGLDAKAMTVKDTEAVWKTIVHAADSHDAAAIVVGTRGLTGVQSALLGSVSGAVVHHAERPVLVIHPPKGDSPKGD